jgi:hypothetical protein
MGEENMAMGSGYRSLKNATKQSVFWSVVSLSAIPLGCGANHVSSGVALGVNVTSLTFPDTAVGSTSPSQTITITNTGIADATITAVTIDGPYQLAEPTCVRALAPKSTCAIAVSFRPQQAGSESGSLTVVSNTISPRISLQGHGSPLVDKLVISAAAAYVREDESTQLSASLNGAPVDNKQVIWQADVGDVSPEGIYSATKARGGTTVSIRATLSSDQLVTGVFSLPIGRPLPQITGSIPNILAPGATTTSVISGANLANVSSLVVNGIPNAFTRLSDSTLSLQISTHMWDARPVSVIASISGFDEGASNTFTIPLALPSVSFDAAARLLQQAAYGATLTGIEKIQSLGMSGWIDQQIREPAYDYTSEAGRTYGQYYRNTQTLQYSLRQRVAFALSQIYVTGNDSVCEASACGPYWEATLEKDSFGNAKDLLRDVALSPIMGAYLNNAYNPGYYGAIPNQNFARELMQLMTLGTVRLDPDGTTAFDSGGKTIPTYDLKNVAAMANALSGWRYPLTSPNLLDMAMIPMVMREEWHNQDAKTILPGLTLPANQSGQRDLNAVIDGLFNHPNYGPFLCRRLIQHLVTSNPSPAYVARISSVFADDGSGTRGNLATVVKAILLDPEARDGDDTSNKKSTNGHFMEPILYIANVMNAVQGTYTDDQIRAIDGALGQQLYGPPSVFGFYSPDHQLPSGTYAPEAQLLNSATGIAKLGFMYSTVHDQSGGIAMNWRSSPFWNCSSPEDFLERVDHLLYHGQMPSAVRMVIGDYLNNNAGTPLNSLLPDLIFLAVSNTAYQTIH